MSRCIFAVFSVLVLSGCPADMMHGDPMSDGEPGDWRPVDERDGGPPEAVRFNEVQMRGTVNSYHDTWRDGIIPETAYRHIALDRQATEQGIRQFDFDLAADRVGGRYPRPINAEDGIDNLNHCGDWFGCLRELRRWSDAHPDHPMAVVLIGEALVHLDLIPALHWQLDVVEEDLIGVLGRERIYAPAEMRRGRASLREAIRDVGWPTVDETRGKYLFVLKDRGQPRTHYIVNGGLDPDDRLLFVAGDPALADDPAVADEVIFTFEPDWVWDYETDRAALPVIRDLAAAGLLVHATTDDPAFAAELRDAGAHMIGTRFPDVLTPIIEQPLVCNLITRPEGCEPGALEPR